MTLHQQTPSHLDIDSDRLEIAKAFILELASRESITEGLLEKMKSSYALLYKTSFLRNSELVVAYNALVEDSVIPEDPLIEQFIIKNKIRTLSGVTPIAILTRPYACRGKCVYCPSEANMPKSYLSNEPAVMRAERNGWSSEKQIASRLRALQQTGHPVSKIELIVMGGTFSDHPQDYQESYIKSAFDAMNGTIAPDLETAKILNERAEHRCIGLNLETRPDCIDEAEILRFRRYGCTRVEMGVQSLYDDVQLLTRRGHDLQAVTTATKLMKDAGLKISYHLMPNLPGSTFDRDVEMIRQTFNDSRFQPDQIKLYPCMVTRFSELEQWYHDGKFEAYTTEELLLLLRAMKKHIPRYVRISRLYRDIPANQILSGSKVTNFRELLHKTMAEHGESCVCTRCREVRDETSSGLEPVMNRYDYDASDGKEIFLSFDDPQTDALYALLRLRIPSQYFSGQKHWMPELQDAALVREVHSYGAQISVGKKGAEAVQHRGLGKRLLQEAERITKEEFGLPYLSVIAGVGVREYYEKQWYEKTGEYVRKTL